MRVEAVPPQRGVQLRRVSGEPARLWRLAERRRVLIDVRQQIAGQLMVKPPHHLGGVEVLKRQPAEAGLPFAHAARFEAEQVVQPERRVQGPTPRRKVVVQRFELLPVDPESGNIFGGPRLVLDSNRIDFVVRFGIA